MYSIEFTRSAEKDLDKIPDLYYETIISKIKKLANEPRPYGHKKLKSYTNYYRIRIAKYRIIYSIQDDKLLIVVIAIDHRKDIYKNI